MWTLSTATLKDGELASSRSSGVFGDRLEGGSAVESVADFWHVLGGIDS